MPRNSLNPWEYTRGYKDPRGPRSAHGKGRMVGPAEREASRHGLHRLEVNAAVAPVVAGIDEGYGPFDHVHDGHVAGRAGLQGAELRHAVDDLGRVDGGHGDDLLE